VFNKYLNKVSGVGSNSVFDKHLLLSQPLDNSGNSQYTDRKTLYYILTTRLVVFNLQANIEICSESNHFK
jgi:hypothetical protein